jgi:imidazolonepropionase-like amidohydrolase
MSHAQSSGAVVASAKGGVDSVEHAFLADRAALEALRESGTTLVPTLTVTDVWSDIPGVSQAIRDNQAHLSVVHRQSCETAVQLGIPLATGTDCGVRGVLADMVWREIWNMHDHGLSAMDAIKAGTSGGARLLGLENEAGAIAVGRQADVILARGNPLQDLKRLSELRLVMQAGAVVRGA